MTASIAVSYCRDHTWNYAVNDKCFRFQSFITTFYKQEKSLFSFYLLFFAALLHVLFYLFSVQKVVKKTNTREVVSKLLTSKFFMSKIKSKIDLKMIIKHKKKVFINR